MEAMMNQTLSISNFKIVFRVSVFLIIFITLFIKLGDVIYLEKAASRRWDIIYSDEELDIVFFGNSHANKTFKADYLTEVGVSSAIIGGSGERFKSTYYNVLEVIDNKPPEVIVLELSSLLYGVDKNNEKLVMFNMRNLQGMKYSKNRLKETMEVIGFRDYLKALFPQILYHENWKGITNWKRNYHYNRSNDYISRGYMKRTDRKSVV